MELKRVYDEDSAEYKRLRPIMDEERAELEGLRKEGKITLASYEQQRALLVSKYRKALPLKYVEMNLDRLGDKQNLSPRILMRLMTEGIISQEDDVLTFNTEPVVRMKIVREPGYFCCHCNTPMPDGGSAREHIQGEHSGLKSPDSSNPIGYRRDNFFACERIS